MLVYYATATHNITCIEHCITVRVLVAAAIWTHFRLYLVASTSYVAVTFSGNLRCMVAVLWLFTLLYIHYKCCLNIIGCTVCVATAMYWRCLNISSVPCLPAPAPATALSEDRRREGGSRTIPRRDEFQIICYFPAAATSRGQKTVTFNRKSSRVAWTTDTVWWCTALYLRPQYVIKHQIHIWDRWPFHLFESLLIICRLSSET